MLINPLHQIEPTDRQLLALVFEHVDDGMLIEIAQADYGDDVDLHLAALHQIRANNIPVPIQWHPGEVLGLTRWTDLSNSELAKRGYWMRLFACAVLIWASLEPEDYKYSDPDWNHLEGEGSTIIQFLDSALHLGEETSIAALKFLGWRMECQIKKALVDEDFGECPCYAVAILLLWISLGTSHPDNSELVTFLISVAHCNDEYFPISRKINECQLAQKWLEAIRSILLATTASDYVRSNPELQQFGLELIGVIGSK